jgi:A/G-specific adenine glycosylase
MRAAPALSRPLPWLRHENPWAILVSEVMLQQTQSARVLGPWDRFMVIFPTPTACANAPLAEVLRAWEGLGYHRRAKSLHDAAIMLRDEFNGQVPQTLSELQTLPGVGLYTASAVASFAFHQPVAVLDTNVGRVVARGVANRCLRRHEALELANSLLPRGDSAAFNQALLDLGARYCRARPLCVTCPVSRVCAWRREGGDDPAPRSAGVSRPQSYFEGSDRQLRGRVLRVLREGPCTRTQLRASLPGVDNARRLVVVNGLIRDGLVERTSSGYALGS